MESENFNVEFEEVVNIGGGTSDFNELSNRPKYNNETMTGDTNIPEVPTKTSDLTNDGADGTSTYVEADNLATVATSGDYDDLSNKPTIPTVNNATLTITQNGVSKGTFTSNASDDTTIEIPDTTYSDFVGTDGTTAGTHGLVPAPATTDAGKFLKADGTWDTAGGDGSGIIELTSADYNYPVNNPSRIALWLLDSGEYLVKAGTSTWYADSYNAPTLYDMSVRVTKNTNAGIATIEFFDMNLGSGVWRIINVGIISGSINTASSRMPGSLYFSTYNDLNSVDNDEGRTLPLSAYQGRVLRDRIDGRIKTNAGAPTTSTTGAVGQLLEDTTNGDLYICTDITGGVYTWEEVGAGGSSVNVVQTTGTSQTDVMSQNAVSSMVFADPGTRKRIQIGNNSAVGDEGVVIGENARTNGKNQIAIGRGATVQNANARGCIALGDQTQNNSAVNGVLEVGPSSTSYGYNSSNYRLISGVYDGQNDHDAVTVGQVNAVIDAINTALNINISHIGSGN